MSPVTPSSVQGKHHYLWRYLRHVDSIGCPCEITRGTAIIFGAAKSSASRTRRNNTRLVVILPSPIASFGNISRYQHRGAKPARLFDSVVAGAGAVLSPNLPERRRLKSYPKLSGPSLYAHWQATGGFQCWSSPNRSGLQSRRVVGKRSHPWTGCHEISTGRPCGVLLSYKDTTVFRRFHNFPSPDRSGSAVPTQTNIALCLRTKGPICPCQQVRHGKDATFF